MRPRTATFMDFEKGDVVAKEETNDHATGPRVSETTDKRSCNENSPTDSEMPGSLVRQPSGNLHSRNSQ